MNTDCAFCCLIEQGAKTRTVAESNLALALLDGYPISPGHTLIIPKRHITSYFDLTSQELEDVMNLLGNTKKLLTQNYAPDAFNVGINDGPAAGQTVNHLHIHLIPRYQGDVPDPRGGVRWVIPDKADYWSKRDD